jgi:hypothetical protein
VKFYGMLLGNILAILTNCIILLLLRHKSDRDNILFIRYFARGAQIILAVGTCIASISTFNYYAVFLHEYTGKSFSFDSVILGFTLIEEVIFLYPIELFLNSLAERLR